MCGLSYLHIVTLDKGNARDVWMRWCYWWTMVAGEPSLRTTSPVRERNERAKCFGINTTKMQQEVAEMRAGCEKQLQLPSKFMWTWEGGSTITN